MNTKDPRLVEQSFHRALPMDPEERTVYFNTFSQTQEWIVGEVNSLLSAYESSPELLEENALELGLSLLSDPEADIPAGTEIGSYKIQRLIGRGGMGDVYLADDLTLDRPVALKFLAAGFSEDVWARRQLVREAQSVAKLNHKNICTVYGYEEIAAHRFIIMEYIEGASLAELERSGKLDSASHGQIAVEIAEAIAEAHSHRILHRDIKPGNIMIGTDGHVKVLDFGIAKFIQKEDAQPDNVTSATRQGLIPGTVAYMSPEQLRAEKLDFRSDIFSLGTVFFEMIAGKHPFEKRSDAETISTILEKPVPFSQLAAVPVGLRQVVKKCLEKEKSSRYQSVSEIVLDLQRPYRRTANIQANSGKIVLAFFMVLLIGIVGFLFFGQNSPDSLALLPFLNETGDPGNDYLAQGMAENLGLKISSYAKLKVKTLTDNGTLENDPIKVGRDNSVDLVMAGKVTRQSDGLVLDTSLLNVATGVKIRGWSFRFEPEDLPSLQQRVADQLFAGLSLSLSENESELNRSGAFSKNGEAVKQYYSGRYLWSFRDEENIKKAIKAFEAAIDLDPGYSRPFSGLADSYVHLSMVAYASVPPKIAMPKARAAARRALDLDPNDVEARTSLAIVFMKYEWNWVSAEKELQLAIQIDPEYAPAHYSYSGLLAILGRTSESIDEAKKAKDLDPFSPMADLNLARTFYYGRRFDDAIATLNSIEQKNSNDKKVRYMLGLVLVQKKMYSEALKIFEEVSVNNRRLAAAALGFTYAKLGRRADALKMLDDLHTLAKEEYIPDQEFAIIYIALNDKDNAMKRLRLAHDERHPALISLKVEPLFDGLRGDPRFSQLATSMQLPL